MTSRARPLPVAVSTPRTRAVALWPILIGLSAGIAGTLLFGQYAHTTQAAPRAGDTTGPRPETAPASIARADNRELEARLARLEAHAATQASSVKHEEAATTVLTSPMPDMSDEAAAKARLDERRRFEAFNEQPIDSRWAKSVALPLEEDLTKIAEARHFKVSEVECRGDACLARAEWPSYAEARDGFKRLAREPLRVNCPRTVQLLPEKEGSPGEVRVLLECASWKAQGSALLAELPPLR